jgi:hypothetical protein
LYLIILIIIIIVIINLFNSAGTGQSFPEHDPSSATAVIEFGGVVISNLLKLVCELGNPDLLALGEKYVHYSSYITL